MELTIPCGEPTCGEVGPSNVPLITVDQALAYEVRSSWVAGMLSMKITQRLAAKYFAKLAARKHARYLRSCRTSVALQKFSTTDTERNKDASHTQR